VIGQVALVTLAASLPLTNPLAPYLASSIGVILLVLSMLKGKDNISDEIRSRSA
jgi:hypothetical protein